MTVSSTVRRAGPYTGNGVAQDFAFTFKVFADTDVVVTEVVTATGVETVKTLTTDYTVVVNANQDVSPGGTVHYLVAPAATRKLVITSKVPATQTVQVTNPGGFFPAIFNDEFDKLTILNQQTEEKVSRALITAVTSGAAGAVPVVPGGFFRWNDAGTALIGVTINDLAGLTAANTLVDNDLAASTTRAPSKSAVVAGLAAKADTTAIAAAITAAAPNYQPVDADLTAIAALATTAYGRALLALADAAAARTNFALEEALRVSTTLGASAAPGVSLPTGYKKWRVDVIDFTPSLSGPTSQLQFTYDGATYVSTTDYTYSQTLMTTGGGSPTGSGVNSDTKFPIFAGGVSNAVGYPTGGFMEIWTNTTNTQFYSSMHYLNAANNSVYEVTRGFIKGGYGTPVGFRFLMSGGNASCRMVVSPQRGF